MRMLGCSFKGIEDYKGILRAFNKLNMEYITRDKYFLGQSERYYKLNLLCATIDIFVLIGIFVHLSLF